MAVVDWALATQIGSTHVNNVGPGAANYGTGVKLIDANAGTYDYVTCATGTSWCQWDVVLSHARYITTAQIYYKGFLPGQGYTINFLVKYNSSNVVNISFSSNGINVPTAYNLDVNQMADEIQVVVFCGRIPASGLLRTSLIYSASLFGEDTDSGLRIANAGTDIKIASETLATGHSVRLYNGTETVGIPLVGTADPSASAVRFFDGVTIQALREYT